MGKEAFNKRRELMTGGMDREVKKRLVKALIWPVALYGCETWTLRKIEIDRLKLLKCGYGEEWKRSAGKTGRKNEVLDAIGEERGLVEAVVKWKKNWIGHIVRGGGAVETGSQREEWKERDREVDRDWG